MGPGQAKWVTGLLVHCRAACWPHLKIHPSLFQGVIWGRLKAYGARGSRSQKCENFQFLIGAPCAVLNLM